MRTALLLLSLAGLCLCAPAQAQDRPHVFRNATLYPISEEPIEQGVMVVEGGTIQAVGPAGSVDVPAGAVEHDVAGKEIMPGLVDTHSHIGEVGGGDGSAAMHPDARTIDAINVRHPSLNRARAGGITTVQLISGSGHLMSGQTTYLKLREGGTVSELSACEEKPVEDCGGMKMANGTNPQRASGAFPGTRARAAAMAREQFVAAQEYRRKKEQADDPSEAPDRNLRMEGLIDVLEGRRTVHFHTHRHDDILTAIRLSEEFGFDLVLHHVSEGWKVADEIAEADVPASIIVLDSPGGKHEADELVYRTGRVLEEAGVDVAYHTDDPITDSRLFLRSPAFGVRAGMSRDAALESVTLAGARMLGLEDEVGSLEEGKDADFIVLSGDPLSVYTEIEQTWVEGTPVFDRSDPDDREFATGGYRVYDGAAQHVHE
ncbi:amidohydrolase family protein [Salinibacter ruber]|uniref:amidohydrolase family protein n=1 Tax=Salinibacter ruber TaxID=146919 RepID=UPI0021688FDF|nr:amidohydrolase family protein [Salinibacter ruber]MCS3647306.1 imidazolonepropionase-like amidohydrolase [Salinibacter ruber]